MPEGILQSESELQQHTIFSRQCIKLNANRKTGCCHSCREYQTGHTYTARSTDVSSIGTVQPLLLPVNFNLDFFPDLRRRTECRWMNERGDVLRGKVTMHRFLQRRSMSKNCRTIHFCR